MWNLDDESRHTLIMRFALPKVLTWGSGDRQKRETIRQAALSAFPIPLPRHPAWAFRIYAAQSTAARCFDVDNVPKLIIDAFSAAQIRDDTSQYESLGLYETDTCEFVRMVQVAGARDGWENRTDVEVFGCKV
jgi:hypothetical protein